MGLALLSASIIATLSSNLSYQKSEVKWTEPNPTTSYDSWNVSRYFEEGDLIKASVSPASDWVEDPFLSPDPLTPYPYKVVWVNITNPFGSESEFYCEFVKPSGSNVLFLYNVTVTESNGLLVGANASLEGEGGIVGKTMSAGEYTASILAPMLYSPPVAFTFSKGERITWIEWPYSNFLYMGVAIAFLGAILLFYGFKKPKKKLRKRGKK